MANRKGKGEAATGISWTLLSLLVMNRDTWHAAVHGVTKSRTWLSDWLELNWIPLQIITAAMKLKDTCCLEGKWKWSCSVVSNSLWPHGLWPTKLLCPWDSPGKSTGVGCHFLLQRIFLTQGLNLGLPHFRQMLYHLSHQGSQIEKGSFNS